jgi:hypothetical protein
LPAHNFTIAIPDPAVFIPESRRINSVRTELVDRPGAPSSAAAGS